MGSITVYTLGQVDGLGIGYPVGDLPPYSYWCQYEFPDMLHYWRLVESLRVGDIVCVAWSFDNSHYARSVYLWPAYWPVRAGLYIHGTERLEWVDDVIYISHLLAGRVPADLLPTPFYYVDWGRESWGRAWDITDMSCMIVWYPQRISLPWYQ